MKTQDGELSVVEGLIGSGPVCELKQGRRHLIIYEPEEARWIIEEMKRFIKAHKDMDERPKKSFKKK